MEENMRVAGHAGSCSGCGPDACAIWLHTDPHESVAPPCLNFKQNDINHAIALSKDGGCPRAVTLSDFVHWLKLEMYMVLPACFPRVRQKGSRTGSEYYPLIHKITGTKGTKHKGHKVPRLKVEKGKSPEGP